MLKRVGFSSKAIYVLSVHDFEEKTPFIAVIKRNNSHLHYVIIYEVNKDDVCIADPYFGILSVKMDNFYNCFSNMIILIYK